MGSKYFRDPGTERLEPGLRQLPGTEWRRRRGPGRSRVWTEVLCPSGRVEKQIRSDESLSSEPEHPPDRERRTEGAPDERRWRACQRVGGTTGSRVVEPRSP